jgi:NADH-quinone oxidoreductase subunit G
LSNAVASDAAASAIECAEPVVADIYRLDSLVRRAPSLQRTADARSVQEGGAA